MRLRSDFLSFSFCIPPAEYKMKKMGIAVLFAPLRAQVEASRDKLNLINQKVGATFWLSRRI